MFPFVQTYLELLTPSISTPTLLWRRASFMISPLVPLFDSPVSLPCALTCLSILVNLDCSTGLWLPLLLMRSLSLRSHRFVTGLAMQGEREVFMESLICRVEEGCQQLLTYSTEVLTLLVKLYSCFVQQVPICFPSLQFCFSWINLVALSESIGIIVCLVSSSGTNFYHDHFQYLKDLTMQWWQL